MYPAIIALHVRAAIRTKILQCRKHCIIRELSGFGRNDRKLNLWIAACTIQGVRIALKAVNANSTTSQAAGAKSSNVSFLDLLAQVSSQAVRTSVPAGAHSEADSDTASDNHESGDGAALQSTTGDVEGNEIERGPIQFVVATFGANTNVSQNGAAVQTTPPQPAQHCSVRSIMQQVQLKSAQSDNCEPSIAFLSVVNQQATAQPADPPATASLSVRTSESQAATSAEQSDNRKPTVIDVIAGCSAAQDGANATLAMKTFPVSNSAAQTLSNFVQPIQEPKANAAQSSIQALDAQTSSNVPAASQINEQGTLMPGSLGFGDKFLQVSSVSKSGDENIPTNAGQIKTANATNNAPASRMGSAPPNSEAPVPLNSAQSTQDYASDAVQSGVQEPEVKVLSSEAGIAQILAQGPSLPGSLGAGDTFFQVPLSSQSNAAENIAPVKAGQLRTAGATSAVDSVESVSNAPANASKSITSSNSGTAIGGIQGGQLSQHPQADTTQIISVAGRQAESTPQPNIFAGHVATGSAGQSDSASRSTDTTPLHPQESRNPSSDRLDDGTTAGTFGINTARLVQSMSETEMRLGMHSTEFGNIAIRTSVSQQQMQAQISVDHGELGNAISAHLPSLQAKLGNDFGLHSSIEINQAVGSQAGRQGQSSQQNQAPIARPISAQSVVPVADIDSLTIPAMQLSNNGGRLDIRA